MSKYRNTVKLCEKVTQLNTIKRPNCLEILESKHLWALDMNEFTINDELRRVLEEKSNDKQSIYHIIYTKLNLNIS
jgi:hypothetical protein